MPLIGINQPARKQRGPSALEKIALAFDIAGKALGTGLAVPKFLQDRKLTEAEIGKTEAATGKLESEARPLTQVEQQEFGQSLTASGVSIPSVALPRTVGEARVLAKTLAGRTIISPMEEKKLDIADETLQIKRDEAARKAAEAKNPKKKELTSQVVLKISEGNVIPTTLVGISKTINEKKELFGPAKGRFGQANVYDVESQAVDAKMRAASQQFGRYMEGGVLRKEDEEKYRRMFPQLSDLPEVASEKLNIVNDMLRSKQEQDLKALEIQGFDVKGLELPAEIKFGGGVPYKKVPGGWDRVK